MRGLLTFLAIFGLLVPVGLGAENPYDVLRGSVKAPTYYDGTNRITGPWYVDGVHGPLFGDGKDFYFNFTGTQLELTGSTFVVNTTTTNFTGATVLSSLSTDAAPASFVTATYTSAMDGSNNDIVFTAVPDSSWGGTLGNSIDIILTDPGEDTTACSVSANTTTGDIDVTLSYGTGAINATALAVMAAIAADATASGMVTCDNATGDDGSGTVTALASQDLSGGVNGTAGTAGELRYYSGDLFYLISGTAFYDATWAQWDGADTDGTPTSSRSFTTTATVTAEQLTSTDDLTVAGLATIGETADVVGAFTAGSMTSDAGVTATTALSGASLSVTGASVQAGSMSQTPLSKSADYTLLDADSNNVYVDASSATATITLPTAADNNGEFFWFELSTDPGEYNVVLDGEGDETIGGAATKTCTDAQYSYYFVYCDGTAYRLVASSGTWT